MFLQKLSTNYTRPVYALKCDIRKFFDSIDHEILLALLKQKINCSETIELLEKIINSFHKTPGKGLPLGNVTSQIFANIYMNSLDWYVKKELGVEYYVRYCDDFILLSLSREDLSSLLPSVQNFLATHLKLELHPDKVEVRKFHQGIDFLGAIILPHYMVLRTNTKKRIVNKSYKILKQVQMGELSKERADQSLTSYLGHLSHTKSRKSRQILFSIRTKIWSLSGTI